MDPSHKNLRVEVVTCLAFSVGGARNIFWRLTVVCFAPHMSQVSLWTLWIVLKTGLSFGIVMFTAAGRRVQSNRQSFSRSHVRGVSTNFPSLGRMRVNKMHKVSCLCEKETWDQWHHCKPGHEDPRTPSPRIANFVQNSTKLFAREGKFVETPRTYE